MAINIRHNYTTHFVVDFYTIDETHLMRYYDYGTIDDVSKRVCTLMNKHNFDRADICSEAGEIFTIIERT